jgi:hypothetical protein
MDTPYRSSPRWYNPDERDEIIAQGVPGAQDPDTWVQPQPQPPPRPAARPAGTRPFEPPVSAVGPRFRYRLERIYACRVPFAIDINHRPTTHVLGGYYKARRLVRVYSHDRREGRRPLHELFDTFLHEVAHHLEYTEPQSFAAPTCRRVPGRMHSRLFWRILGELKFRWAELQARERREAEARSGR